MHGFVFGGGRAGRSGESEWSVESGRECGCSFFDESMAVANTCFFSSLYPKILVRPNLNELGFLIPTKTHGPSGLQLIGPLRRNEHF